MQTVCVIEDPERCYLAVRSRDPRFDGWFVTAVTSTGIYCRPSCPARTPHRRNVRFLPGAAAAQRAGVPGLQAVPARRHARLAGVGRAGGRGRPGDAADRRRGGGPLGRPGLADRLGYSVRQLERLLAAEVGAGPLALARAQRAQTARVLIETTALTMAEVAFAAGFTSIRQFNDTVRGVFGVPPSALRAATGAAARPARSPGDPVRAPAGALSLRLPFRQPLSADNLFGHLAATAVPGVEEVVGSTYRRTLRLDHGPGIVALTPGPAHVDCRIELADLADLTSAIARCRRLLDLDADPEADRRNAVRRSGAGSPPGGRRSRTTGAAHGRRRRVRRAGRARPAGLDRRRTHRRRRPGGVPRRAGRRPRPVA